MKNHLKHVPVRRARKALAVAAAATVVMAVGPIASTAGASSAAAKSNKKPITVGVVVDFSGGGAATWGPASAAFNAEVNAINASGGVNHHKINLVTVDGQSSTTANLTAVQSLVQNRGASVIVEMTGAESGGADWLSQNGIPMIDGGTSIVSSTDHTVFSTLGGDNPDPSLGNTTVVKFLKSVGAHSVGDLALSICGACILGAIGTGNAAQLIGLQKGYINTTIQFGTTTWTPYVLGLQNANTDAVSLGLDVQDSLLFINAEKTQGLNLKVVSGALFVPSLLSSPATSSTMQGIYADTTNNPNLTSAPVKAMIRVLKKYGDAANASPPGVNESKGYLTGLLLQEALSVAGTNPTSGSIVNGMSKVKKWSAGGMLGYNVNFTLEHTTAAPLVQGPCLYFLKGQGTGFVVANGGKPVCTPTVRVITS